MIIVEHVFTCDARECDYEERMRQEWRPPERLLRPHPLNEWTRVGSLVFCPRHDITLIADPKDPKDPDTIRSSTSLTGSHL